MSETQVKVWQIFEPPGVDFDRRDRASRAQPRTQTLDSRRAFLGSGHIRRPAFRIRVHQETQSDRSSWHRRVVFQVGVIVRPMAMPTVLIAVIGVIAVQTI
jgi:hypothetical protein